MTETKLTLEHIKIVREYLNCVIEELTTRAEEHDRTKLHTPEVGGFAKVSHKLKKLTYNSDEYKAQLKKMKPFLDHHYANNRHHPEHFKNGVVDMTLIDLIEMICDWKAATLRHDDGDIYESVNENAVRFKYGFQLTSIFKNTVDWMEGL